jgi:hypothetical protein
MEQKTMAQTMTPTMAPNNAHKDIPGNPSTAKSSATKLNDRSNGKPLRVLSEDDWKFWKELANTGMVEVYNNQYLWNNRQMQRLYDAFVDIWGTEKLWVTIDRANLNFPMRPGFEYKGFIHWDYDPDTKPVNVQGVLALADQTDENMGGFQCVPELFRTYNAWKLTQPENRDHFKPDISGFELKKVKMEAGDLLIFNSLQPHGIRLNLSGNKVRIAQYISMMPAEEDNEILRQWRINSWKDRIAPEGYAFPGDPRNWEKTKYGAAQLTDLGKKLLGLEKW